jgi:hypothetical protein
MDAVDDGTAGLHVRNGGLGHIEHSVDVDLEGQLPLLVRDVGDILEACLMGGVVDEDVDTA